MDSSKDVKKNLIRKTKITTTLGKTYLVSPEIGLSVRRAIQKGVQHIMLDKAGKTIIKVGIIAEVDEVYERKPQDFNLLADGRDSSKEILKTEGYRRWLEARSKLVKKKLKKDL